MTISISTSHPPKPQPQLHPHPGHNRATLNNQMRFSAWNKSTNVDLVVLVVKVLVAIALIGHAHYIQAAMRPEPVYGVLNDPAYTYTVQDTQRILTLVSWMAGGYVLASSLVGLVGRAFLAAPLYGVYYCTNVFGFAVCMAAAVVPTMWGTTKEGYCLAAENACLFVEDLTLCPYPVTFAEGGPGTVSSSSSTRRALAQGTSSSSPCCYLPPLVKFCSTFLGSIYAHTIIAVVLLALVMTQSMVSCWYLCCDCDRPWSSTGRAPELPELPEFVIPRIDLRIGEGNKKKGKGGMKERDDAGTAGPTPASIEGAAGDNEEGGGGDRSA